MNNETFGDAWVNCMALIFAEGVWEKDGSQMLLEKRNISIKISSVDSHDPIIVQYADHSRIELMKQKHESIEIVNPFKVSYGKALYCNLGINQIDHLVQRLLTKRETKAATISLHTPGEDYSTCLSLLDCKIRNNVLDFTAVYRSQNVYGSQPGNILALADIHRSIAVETNSVVGDFYLYVISGHIYDDDILSAKAIVDEVMPHV